MAEQRSLIRHAKDAEDVASGLHNYRDSLPRSATRITAIISELFALSSILRELDNSYGDVHFSSSFYRVQDDLKLLLPSLQRTLQAAFDTFSRSREKSYQQTWDDLGREMHHEEGIGLLERLKMYHEFLRAQVDMLQGRRARDVHHLRQELSYLKTAQERSILRAQRLSLDTSGRPQILFLPIRGLPLRQRLY